MIEESSQIRKNLVFNILSLLINLGVGVLYTPFLVKALGVSAYGVIPLALIINQYISVFTGALTSSLTRFYVISVQKEDYKEASNYISTSFVIVLLLVGIIALPLYYFVQNINLIFNVPGELLASAKSLFAFTIISFVCSLFSSVFNITLYAYNRLDYLNIISIVRLSFRFILIVLFFTFLGSDISYVGLATLVVELLILLLSLLFFIKLTKGNIKVNLLFFDKYSLNLLSIMTVWIVLQQLGDIMLYRTDNLVINKFWSTTESGILGAFTELGAYTMTISGVITSLFGPLILKAYGKDEHEKVKKLVLNNSVSVGVLIAVIVGVICGFSSIILKVWLSDDFVVYNSWLYLKLIFIPFYSAGGIFSFAARAWNKVRFPAIGTVILGFLNFFIVWVLGLNYNSDSNMIILILMVCMIFGIAQSYFLNGFLFGRLYPNTWKIVFYNSLKIAIVLILVTVLSYYISLILVNCNMIYSLLIIALFGLVCLIVSLKLALSKEQLTSLLSLVKKTA